MPNALEQYPEQWLGEQIPEEEELDLPTSEVVKQTDDEQPELEQLLDDIHELMYVTQRYFSDYYITRWGKGDVDFESEVDAYEFYVSLDKQPEQQMLERSIVVPFKRDSNYENDIFLGWTVDYFSKHHPRFVFQFVDQNGKKLHNWIEGNEDLISAYAKLVDPNYRKLVSLLENETALQEAVLPTTPEEIVDTFANHEAIDHLLLAFDVDMYPHLIDMITINERELADDVRRTYLRQNRLNLLRQFEADLALLYEKLVTQGIE